MRRDLGVLQLQIGHDHHPVVRIDIGLQTPFAFLRRSHRDQVIALVTEPRDTGGQVTSVYSSPDGEQHDGRCIGFC